MKRINSDTKKVFKQGDKRPSTDKQDGKVFYMYKSKSNVSPKTGYQYEWWCLPEEVEIINVKRREVARIAGNKKYAKKKKLYESSDEYKKKMEWKQTEVDLKKLKKRPNKDGNPFRKGEIENGKYFIRYVTNKHLYSTRRTELGKSVKYFDEVWGTEEELIDHKVTTTASHKKHHHGSDLDAEYLRSIFPKDRKCPLTRKRFVYTPRHNDSPELDRINPKMGYVKGNVVWISSRMNILKRDATASELKMLATYASLASMENTDVRKWELIEDLLKIDREEEGNIGIGREDVPFKSD